MIRGTTPTITFTIQNQDVDLTAAENVYVTFVQGITVIQKSNDDLEIEARTVSVWLTQEESLKLADGSNCKVQINWTYLATDGEVRRAATEVKTINIGEQLLKRVIE